MLKPIDLKTLKRLCEWHLTTLERFKQTGDGEAEAEEAFNELHLALDGRTVETLIARAEQAATAPRIIRAA